MMAQLAASVSLELAEPTLFARFLASYAGIGCRSLQGFWRQPLNLTAAGVPEIVRSVTAAGLSFDSVHGSFGDDFDVSTPIEAVRLRTLLTHEQDAQLAGALGGSLVVVHPSCCIPAEVGLVWSHRTTAGNHPRGGADESWGNAIDKVRAPLLLDSMEKLARIGAALGIVFALENVPGYLWYGHHAAQLATLIRRLDSPHVRMCFDLGHAQLEAVHFGSAATQLAACLDVVGYVHVHDNDGLQDLHLVPGAAAGVIDWEEIRSVVRDGPRELIWMLELFGKIDELDNALFDNNAARDRLGRLFDL